MSAWAINKRMVVLALAIMLIAPIIQLAEGDTRAPTPPTNISVRVTSVWDMGAEISWITDKPCIGRVIYGLNSSALSYTVYDERGENYKGRTHLCILTQLISNTTYYFRIVDMVDGTNYTSSQIYNFTTINFTVPSPAPTTIYGWVKDSLGHTYTDTLIYYMMKRGENTSNWDTEYVHNDGSFVIVLSNVYDKDYHGWTAEKGDVIVLEVHSPPYGNKSTEITIDWDPEKQSPHFIGNISVSLPFNLTNGKVEPDVGYPDTVFTFYVTYTAEDNIAPDAVYVVVNGVRYEMTPVNESDKNYTDGVVYHKTVSNLSPGSIEYYFGVERGGYETNTSASPLYLVVKQPAVGGGGGASSSLLAIIAAIIILAIILALILAIKRRYS
ncbi:MAG: hypothetical protein DRN20_02780 [Thermoplasmata archaeon]|nr:MAG: hypothetical protein DRN20_02780 [Thermoplasmata archaeon]